MTEMPTIYGEGQKIIKGFLMPRIKRQPAPTFVADSLDLTELKPHLLDLGRELNQDYILAANFKTWGQNSEWGLFAPAGIILPRAWHLNAVYEKCPPTFKYGR